MCSSVIIYNHIQPSKIPSCHDSHCIICRQKHTGSSRGQDNHRLKAKQQFECSVDSKRGLDDPVFQLAPIFYRELLKGEKFSCLSIQWKIISCKKPISFSLWTHWELFSPTGSGSLRETRASSLTKDFPSAASNPPHMFLIDLHKPQ